jgi:CRP-like cAMP-binding protein
MSKPERLTALMKQQGILESYKIGHVFHTQDFPETMFMLKSGFAKRYQIKNDNKKVIELIYGPGEIFPLSQLYRQIFNVEQNQENIVYVYQAMTDIEIYRVSDDVILDAIEKDNNLYIDLYYESGIRLKSNINRLASNAIQDDYKKVAHQLVCLADEFGETSKEKGKEVVKIVVPLEPRDMAEQLNISTEVADAVMNSLSSNKIILIRNNKITIPDLSMLKVIYL